VVEVLGIALLGLGLVLATVGLVGLLRMPDVFQQLHAAGLVTGPATLLVLLAAVATRDAEIITSAALVILFVLVTAPLSGHAVAQAAYRGRGSGDDEGDEDDADGADASGSAAGGGDDEHGAGPARGERG
jgi:monovalent cation/proton antiporter MnhG/PhaG subunit